MADAKPKVGPEATAQAMERLAELERENQKLKQELKREKQATDLSAFLLGCHKHSHMPLRARFPTKRTTICHSTARKKWVLKPLAPWTEFPELAHGLVASANDHLTTLQGPQADKGHVFDAVIFMEQKGALHCLKPIANEADLRIYQHNAIEVRIYRIIQEIAKTSGAKLFLGEGRGIVFENDPNSLSDINPEVQESLERGPHTPSTARRPPTRATSDSDARIPLDRSRTD